MGQERPCAQTPLRADAAMETRVPCARATSWLRDAELKTRVQSRSLRTSWLRDTEMEPWMQSISRRACLSVGAERDQRCCHRRTNQRKVIGFRHPLFSLPMRQHAVSLRKPFRTPVPMGERVCGCGGAGAPCPNCSPTDPDDVPAHRLQGRRRLMQEVKRSDQQHRRRDPDGDHPQHLFALEWRHRAHSFYSTGTRGPDAEGRIVRRLHSIRRSVSGGWEP